MLESNFVIAYFCIIIALQSIIGVGVLVLSTPFLLILNFNIIEIFFIYGNFNDHKPDKFINYKFLKKKLQKSIIRI